MARGRGIILRLRRFGRARKGAVAVEFALIAVPFFWLVMALAEITLIGFAQTTLDFAIDETARRIRTGEVQTEGLSAEQLQEEVCGQMSGLLNVDCGNLNLDIQAYPSFVDVENDSPLDGSGNLQTAEFDYDPGAPSEIVMARAFYRWNVVTPYFRAMFSNTSTAERLLVSTVLFRNEPYESTP